MTPPLPPTRSATPTPGFKTRLKAKIAATGTSLCVGIDPHLSELPPFFANELRRDGAAAFLAEMTGTLIDASVGVVPAVKLQSAFFEAHGPSGVQVLQEMMRRAKERGLLTVLDAKRGDISSTMFAYGQMAFDAMEADCLTVTPYIGLDVTEPLTPWLAAGRGVYLVWVSSNPGGALVQQPLMTRLFDAFVRDFQQREIADALGFVLGATKVDALPKDLIPRLKVASLLMPGVGAQGGAVTPLVKGLMRDSGAVLVPQSRALSAFTPDVTSWREYGALVEARIRSAAAELRV